MDVLTIPPGTIQDAVLLDIIESDHSNTQLNPTVYATDNYLANIMTLKSSIFPWEISVTKEGN